ncbi:LysR family transcriptional regulator [Vibrio sp. E150_011]
MGQFEDLRAFVAVARSGSITKASEQLDSAKSAVSRRLNELEERVGVKLLTRTTRQQKLTEAGTIYLERAEEIVDRMEELNDAVCGSANAVEGWIRMSAPLGLGSRQVSFAVQAFMKIHPKVRIHLSLVDSRPNIVSEQYDIGIIVGDVPDSNLVAKRLMTVEHVLCASPGLIERVGQPKTMADLARYDYLQYAGTHIVDPLILYLQQSDQKVALNVILESNNGVLLKDMAVSGHGILCLPNFIANSELKDGNLVKILEDIKLPSYAVSAIYPQRKYMPLRCRLLVEHLTNWFCNIH